MKLTKRASDCPFADCTEGRYSDRIARDSKQQSMYRMSHLSVDSVEKFVISLKSAAGFSPVNKPILNHDRISANGVRADNVTREVNAFLCSCLKCVMYKVKRPFDSQTSYNVFITKQSMDRHASND